MKDYTKICRQPWSPIFFDTSLKWIVGEFASLNLNFGLLTLVGIRVGYSFTLFSMIFGTIDIEYQLRT